MSSKDKVKSNKEDRKIKFFNKKYTFLGVVSVIYRQIFYFLFLLSIGAFIGTALYTFIPSQSFKSSCYITYDKKLDDSQIYRVVDYITCNEAIDIYVDALKTASIKKDSGYYTFNDVANGISSKYEANITSTVTFTISFAFNKQNKSLSALQVIATKACQQLNDKGFNGKFNINSSSYIGDQLISNKNTQLIYIPIIISAIASFLVMFFVDGFDDAVYDHTDGVEYCEKYLYIRKSNKPNPKISDFVDLVSNQKAAIMIHSKDVETFKIFLNAQPETKDLFEQFKTYDYEQLDGFENENKKYLIVILGNTYYSAFYKVNENLKKRNVKLDNIIYIDYKYGVVKNDKKSK